MYQEKAKKKQASILRAVWSTRMVIDFRPNSPFRNWWKGMTEERFKNKWRPVLNNEILALIVMEETAGLDLVLSVIKESTSHNLHAWVNKARQRQRRA